MSENQLLSCAIVSLRLWETCTYVPRNILQLVELSFDTKVGAVYEVDVFRAHEVIRKISSHIGSLCFVVRRPGETLGGDVG